MSLDYRIAMLYIRVLNETSYLHYLLRSIDGDLHKLMNTILCKLKNLKDLLSLSPLIIINNILSGVLAIIAFYLTFYLPFLLRRIV